MGPISAYKNLKDQAQQPQQAIIQPQQPQIDTSDPINSLAGMLVTPAEREAQQQKLMENKRKMLLWTGLFDGLRNLGNLYSVSKGARPQQYTDNPYKTIEIGYQQEMKNLDDVYKNRQAYAQQLYNWQRQANDDKRKEKLADAQAQWYGTRDELARLKADNDRLRAEQQASVNEARRKQIELKTKQMEELHPLQKQKLQATIKNTLHNANRPYGGSRGGGSRGSSSDPFAELATQLNDNPDIIGPILEQEGLGFYDKNTKEFNFSKNATKGMATTATRRAATQRQSPKVTKQPTKTTSNATRSGNSTGKGSNRSGFFNK